ncbi:heat shock factor binding protein 1-domain-containing protein [Leptodontidium sp. 2 PMI_412]|nr:putative heat shock factor-binding protein 1 [Leptodontidium sp. MPI-SDFR-AT-0119]KAH9216901.1 heat shock factor binding protein 1-domain-containing protein [Leptodontidium sp. 2 PMI_412]
MASNQSSSSPTNTNDNRNSVNSIAGDATAPAELSAVVDELLNSLSNKFAGVSSEIFAKMDEMSRRLDNLEATLQSNIDGRDGKSSPTK